MKKWTCTYQDDMPTQVGVYTVDDDASTQQQLFITEAHTFVELCAGLGSSRSCGMEKGLWVQESITQVGAGCLLSHH